MHIGGMSHYLSPSGYIETESGDGPRPEWARYPNMKTRFQVARFTASMLRARIDGDDEPPIPADLPYHMELRLQTVQDAIVDMVDRYRWC